jgi:hypothetical protein
LTKKQLRTLAEGFTKYDLQKLPERMGKNLGVNPHVVSITFGKRQSVMILAARAPLPETDPENAESPEEQFATLVGLLQRTMMKEEALPE